MNALFTKTFLALVAFLALLAIWIIRIYRPVGLMLWGPCCRFHPSCSVYMEEAIRSYGVWKGVRLGLGRLGRCHPFHEGGLDPVPVKARVR